MSDKRLFENLSIWLPAEDETAGEYDLPMIGKQPLPKIVNWMPFSDAKSKTVGVFTGIHMFVEDYRIARLWNYPLRYLDILRSAACVLSPDFSMYTDEPKALQISCAYRRQWLGAWWQRNGVTVIPTVCWADEDSYEWCFDGIPINAVVAVSTVGTQKHKQSKTLFVKGYDAMLERCAPEAVVVFGTIPEGMKGNIISAGSFTQELRKRLHN